MLQTAVVTLALTAVEAYAEESVETLADRLADKASRLPNTEQYRSLNCSAGKLQNAVEVYCNSMANMDARYAQVSSVVSSDSVLVSDCLEIDSCMLLSEMATRLQCSLYSDQLVMMQQAHCPYSCFVNK